MNITFTEDHQSVASGNEFYRKGAQATLTKGQALIDMGVAYAGWGKPPLDIKIEATYDGTGVSGEIEQIAEFAEPELIDLDKITKSELVEVARAYGVSYAGLKKAELAEALKGIF